MMTDEEMETGDAMSRKHEKQTKKTGKTRTRKPTWTLGIIIDDPAHNGKNVGKIVKVPRKVVEASSAQQEAVAFPHPLYEEISKAVRRENAFRKRKVRQRPIWSQFRVLGR